ncbi:hypothetical protein M427DRAFT_318542 [Gonapodya prolifera JEL478]|uniref:B box-type domain-containing protein n=1 Tax=Gonapodya prolifera (strain JEL478) TaxID=1344416 RepID=A0A139AXC4_GONPJ|nr:hypothetical protein M427DRAFT_318542 [Gonapodya prolifera JEL478]|eukprot:KXS21396.1 hypothetical protein M427DRAFT_318542 [Gonapodya prolifera JEL478]
MTDPSSPPDTTPHAAPDANHHPQPTLADILDGRVSDLSSEEEDSSRDGDATSGMTDADTDGDRMDMSQAEASGPRTNCAECEDHPADLHCTDCDDLYCDVCFVSQHRKGKRALHRTTRVRPPNSTTTAAASGTGTGGGQGKPEPAPEVRDAIPGVEAWEPEEDEGEEAGEEQGEEQGVGEWFVGELFGQRWSLGQNRE